MEGTQPVRHDGGKSGVRNLFQQVLRHLFRLSPWKHFCQSKRQAEEQQSWNIKHRKGSMKSFEESDEFVSPDLDKHFMFIFHIRMLCGDNILCY